MKLTTHLCFVSYTSLLAIGYWRHGAVQHLHWHFMFLAVVALTGFAVAYHVRRVSVLGHFFSDAAD